MLPARIDAELAFPIFLRIFGEIAGRAASGQAGHGTL